MNEHDNEDTKIKQNIYFASIQRICLFFIKSSEECVGSIWSFKREVLNDGMMRITRVKVSNLVQLS